MNRYSTEEKQQAIDLYFKNGCNMTTVTGTVAHKVSLLAQYEPTPKSQTKNLTLGRLAFMIKYSFEQKKALVTAYLNGEGGIRTVIKKYGYSNRSQLQRWIVAY